MTIATAQTFFIKPVWHPMDTAPKDGSVIRIAVERSNDWVDATDVYHADVFWGKMTGYSDCDEVWVRVANPTNGLEWEHPFIHQKGKGDSYFGSRFLGWTRPWDIVVDYPEVSPVEYIVDVIE